MIQIAVRLLADPRVRLSLILLLLSGMLLACDDRWDPLPPFAH